MTLQYKSGGNEIKNDPANIMERDRVELTCKPKGFFEIKRWEWYFQRDGSFTETLKQDGKTIIVNMSIETQGEYSCEATSIFGKTSTCSKKLKLKGKKRVCPDKILFTYFQMLII